MYPNYHCSILILCLLLAQHAFANDRDFAEPPLANPISPPGEKVIIVDPQAHAWGAYDANGTLVRYGLATAGADWCEDMQSECRTEVGTFRIISLGDGSCVSPSFPIPNGGAHMPYCMYFNKYQALHGYADNHVVHGNISHGCVRMHTSDAKWLRYHFVEGPNAANGHRGTLVQILPY